MAKKKSKQCKHCQHWNLGWADDKSFAECYHPRMQSGSADRRNAPAPLVSYGGYDGYGDYFKVSPEFGCILWEERTV